MNFRRTEIPTNNKVESLCWRGDALMDPVSAIEYRLDGKASDRRVNWGYRFDAAVHSVSGRYVVIYEKLGTKGLLLRDVELVRELNRSFYCADAYEFPVTFTISPDGRELLIHCPDEYNRIEIEEVDTGERITAHADRKPSDFFHSRLQVSADGRWLLSAGWFWHPLDLVCCFDLRASFENPLVLDSSEFPDLGSCEVNSATFLDNDRLLLASGPEAEDFGRDSHEGLKPGHLAVFDLQQRRFERVVKLDGVAGTMMAVGADHVVSFYEHPRLVDLRSGEVIVAWPDIVSGKQNSSIIWHQDPPPPPMALDSEGRRFAVAQPERIVVIELGD